MTEIHPLLSKNPKQNNQGASNAFTLIQMWELQFIFLLFSPMHPPPDNTALTFLQFSSVFLSFEDGCPMFQFLQFCLIDQLLLGFVFFDSLGREVLCMAGCDFPDPLPEFWLLITKQKNIFFLCKLANSGMMSFLYVASHKQTVCPSWL